MDRAQAMKSIVYSSILLSTILLTGCPDVRDVELCMIDLEEAKCKCSLSGDDYQKPLSYCSGWIAASKDTWNKIAERLEYCRGLEEECKK